MTIDKAVVHWMEFGWQPYGYPYLDKNGNEKQAMVMYEVESNASKTPATVKNRIGGVTK